MSDKDVISLRPHHGLCLGFFEGRGYSDGFSRSMAALLEGLDGDSAVRLAEGHDSICISCPNQAEVCPNAAIYDRRVLQLCKLTAGERLTWSDFQKRLRKRVLEPGRLAEVCGSCEWFYICGNKEYRD